jgi:triosephosphate isomerase (TIM)
MIFLNFKTYEQTTGKRALELLKTVQEVAESTAVKIIVAISASDIKEASVFSHIEIWGQHVDSVTFGAHTGAILAHAIKEDGAQGTFLNHSEHKFTSFDELKVAHDDAKEIGLETLIFAASVEECSKVANLNPNFIGYEPPELIASKETSVAKAKPDVIKNVVDANPQIPIIVGAGVKDQNDVRVSLQLGAKGVALASAVVLADDPKAVLEDLVKGFLK